VIDNLRQVETVSRLKEGIEAKLYELRTTLDRIKDARADEALAIVNGGAGMRIMDAIRRDGRCDRLRAGTSACLF
jgi:CHASE3 domain sensor protein